MEEIVPLISVIIPIYNVEHYLQKCVDSVLRQNFPGIEVILVDDGSSDSCPRICDDYALKDSRVKVIHKINGGVSDARNVGIDFAKGEYLMFLDSDDYWENEYSLFTLIQAIKGRSADVILYGSKDFYSSNGHVKISRTGYNVGFLNKHSIGECVKELFEHKLFPGSAWILAVRRRILLDNKIYFVKGIKAEDYDWLINLFLHIRTIDAINDPFYIYVKERSGSITNTSDINSIHSLMFIVDKWFPVLIRDRSLRNIYFLNLLAFIYLTSLVTYCKLSDNQKLEILPEMRKREYIINYAVVKKVKVLSLIYKLLGIRLMAYLIGIIRR